MAYSISDLSDEETTLRLYFDDIADSRPLSREREVALSERIDEGDMQARDELVKALETDNLPQKCSSEQTWNGRKCQSYCDVRYLCPYNNGSING